MRKYRFNFFMWTVRFLVSVFVVAIIWGIIVYQKNKPLCDKCNVILVSLDTLSALHLPCYGYERNTAPNLCAYASKNITFLNSYSQAPTTLDSHFSIFTSLYPHTHKITKVFEDPLNEKYLTLAQVLRLSGYQTIYHNSYNDLHLPLDRGIERGFDIFEGDSANINSWGMAYAKLTNNVNIEKKTFLFLHTYDAHDPYLTGHKKIHLFTNQPEYPNIPLTGKEYYELTPDYFKFIVNWAKEENFYLNKNKTLQKDNDVLNKIDKESSLEKKQSLFNSLSVNFRSTSFSVWGQQRVGDLDTNGVEYMKALYDEHIHDMDQNLGKLFQLMNDPKISNNTILIITADHGEEFMEHGKLYHAANLYETSTRVPLIIHIPGLKPQKITEMAQGIDIYPTVLSLLGLKPQSTIEGIDLTYIIKGDNNPIKNKYLLSEFSGIAGLQQNNWRFYYRIVDQNPIGLYNTDTDLKEQNNLLQVNNAKVIDLTNLMHSINIPW